MGDAQANRARCRALKRDGQPCSAPAVRNGLCIGHQGEDNRAWSVKGGKATSHRERSAKLLPSRLRPIVDGLEAAFYAVQRGQLEPRAGAALASIASAIVRVFQAGELGERVRALEGAEAEEPVSMLGTVDE